MPKTKEAWIAVISVLFSIGLTVTPGIQTWWLAGPAWVGTMYAAWRWFRHGADTQRLRAEGEIRRQSGWVWMMAEQRDVSVEIGFINPDRIRYQWEPKSEVSADVVGATIRFLRLTPERRTSVHIHWELVEYDHDVEQHQLHMLKS